MNSSNANSRASSRRDKQTTLSLVLVILAGLGGIVTIARRHESHPPPTSAEIESENLYLSGNTVRRMSLGFNGIVADWYWMRSLQYVGKKIIDSPHEIQIDNLGELDLKMLAPLLEAATTVDPQFMEPYQYAAVVLVDVDPKRAIEILNRGIVANPSAWRLHQHLGFIYWKLGDFRSASEVYGKGAAIPGAPPWMEAMKAKMFAEGGSRNLAREIYGRMFQQAEDEQVRDMARRRLYQLDSLDQRDVLQRVLSLFQSKFGRCPSAWREIEAALRSLRFPQDSAGAPVDPSGAAYVLEKSGCNIQLGPNSLVPGK